MNTKLQKTKKTLKSRKQSPEIALEQEWRTIQQLQKENEHLEEELHAFEQMCHETLHRDEERMALAVCLQAMHLSGFLTRKSLTKWQRAELRSWIEENLSQASASPFCEEEILRATFAHVDAIEASLQPATLTEEEDPLNAEHEAPLDTRTFEEIFNEFIGDDDFNSSLNDDSTDDHSHDHFQEHMHREQKAAQEQAKSLQTLLKKSSMNTLFRRLARLLHPDREQNVELKKQRHEEMIKLTQARDNNDVFTLLSLYQKHTGESPLDAIAESSEDLLIILKRQSLQMQEQRNEIIYSNPLRSHFYDRFYAKTLKSQQRKLRNYCKELQVITENEHQITHSIRSIATLKPYLEDRYDQHSFNAFDDFF